MGTAPRQAVKRAPPKRCGGWMWGCFRPAWCDVVALPMGFPSQTPWPPASPSLAGRRHAQTRRAGAPFQPLLWGPYLASRAGPCLLPTLSRVLPASPSDGAKQRVQSSGGSGKVRGMFPRSLGGMRPKAAFLVDISAGCSSKLALLQETWSHIVSARVATSALPPVWTGRDSALCYTLQQLLRSTFVSTGERIRILLCFHFLKQKISAQTF